MCVSHPTERAAGVAWWLRPSGDGVWSVSDWTTWPGATHSTPSLKKNNKNISLNIAWSLEVG